MITAVRGRRVWDSRGRPTVEAEVHLEGGSIGRAIAPAGASRGRHEAVELRDGGERFGGYDVTGAVSAVNGPIAAGIRGLAATDQEAVDARLRELDGTPDKSRLGGNAIVAVSLACLHAAAAANGLPTWRYLAGDRPVRLPVPEIQIFGGGAHAARRVDIQDFMIMCPSAPTFEVAIARTADVYRHAGRLMQAAGLLAGTADEGGWWPAFDSNEAALDMLVRSIEAAGLVPGDDVHLSLDVAASEFFDGTGYRLALDGRTLDRDGMLELLGRWLERYPILSLEDPVAEDDTAGSRAFTAAWGDRVQVVGDDLLVTSPDRVRRGVAEHWCNAALIKVNQVGTVSEARAACAQARAAGWGTLVSARSGDTEDLSIVHLATGWDAGQIKVGSFARSERTAKWNELLRIEEALGAGAHYAGWSALPRTVQAGRREAPAGS
ncbi:MAG: phosphopyruvate hydratase [Pseudomonadales bacterium]|nr:phosphopyruvate hydratase [Pseudomonadales bacterium]